MILEVAVLDVVPGQESEFQGSFAQAQNIISSMPGYISHDLRRCIEKPSRYILLVSWEKLEDHTVGFRGSAQYQQWKSLLHRYYDPISSGRTLCRHRRVTVGCIDYSQAGPHLVPRSAPGAPTRLMSLVFKYNQLHEDRQLNRPFGSKRASHR